MASSKGDLGLIVAQFALLLGIVAFVDQVWLRLGMTFAVALLLVQRATGAVAAAGPPGGDRRQDEATRDGVSRLLALVRDFYAACHLTASGQISPEEAMARSQMVEKQLNLLLAKVVQTSRGEVPPVDPAPP